MDGWVYLLLNELYPTLLLEIVNPYTLPVPLTRTSFLDTSVGQVVVVDQPVVLVTRCSPVYEELFKY